MASEESESKDDEFYRRVLSRKRTTLLSDLDPEPLLDILLEKELITSIVYRDIQESATTTEKNRHILDLIEKNGKKGYVNFKRCLRKAEQEHLADVLEREETQLEKTGRRMAQEPLDVADIARNAVVSSRDKQPDLAQPLQQPSENNKNRHWAENQMYSNGNQTQAVPPREEHGVLAVDSGEVSQLQIQAAPLASKDEKATFAERKDSNVVTLNSQSQATCQSTDKDLSQLELGDTYRLGNSFSNAIAPDFSADYKTAPFQPGRSNISSLQQKANTVDGLEQRDLTVQDGTPTASSNHSLSLAADSRSHTNQNPLSVQLTRALDKLANALSHAAEGLDELRGSTVTLSGPEATTQSPDIVSLQSSGDQVDASVVSVKELKEKVKRSFEENHDGRLLTLSVSFFEDIIETTKDQEIEGGFGVVYVSTDALDIPVVVKKIHCTEATSKQKMMSITNEKLASRTMHFAIVPLLAVSEDYSKSIYYFLSPYLVNGNLYEAIRNDTMVVNGKLGSGDIRLNKMKRLKIIYHIVSALHYLHTDVEGFRGRILHMDIKTQNIVLDAYENARLIDFGLAREMHESDKSGIIVTKSEATGTKGYFPTTAYNQLTEKEDFYNFGIVIRELLTGKPPFNEGTQEMLRKLTKRKIQRCIQSIWNDNFKSSTEADQLNELSTLCIDKKVDPRSVKEKVQDLIGVPAAGRWERDQNFKDTRCENCMINKSAPETEILLQHSLTCRCKIRVCVACMRNSFLNPIICHSCGETLNPMIGNGWGGLLIAGNDTCRKEAAKGMSRDIKKVYDILISKCPLVMGIPNDNVQVVKPANPGEAEVMMHRLEEAVKSLAVKDNIKTVVIYFSGHHSVNLGFQLGSSNEILTVLKLQEKMSEIAEGCCKSKGMRFIIFLDCCACPDLTDIHQTNQEKTLNTSKSEVPQPDTVTIAQSVGCAKQILPTDSQAENGTDCTGKIPKLKIENCCVLQVNSCSASESTEGGEDGSFFSALFVKALTQRAFKTPCTERITASCRSTCDTLSLCNHFNGLKEKDFIFMEDLFGYIDAHMKDMNRTVPIRHISNASWNDAIIAYNIDFDVAIVFSVKDEALRDENFPTITLKRNLFSEMDDLKGFLFQRLMEKKLLYVGQQLDFANCICIEIDLGPKKKDELDTIYKVNAAWNSRRELSVSLRQEKNIHRGPVMKIVEFAPEIAKRLKLKEFPQVASERDPFLRFTMNYNDVETFIEDHADVTNDPVLSTFTEYLENIEDGIKEKDVKTSTKTELHFLFPRGGMQEKFMCIEMKFLD